MYVCIYFNEAASISTQMVSNIINEQLGLEVKRIWFYLWFCGGFGVWCA